MGSFRQKRGVVLIMVLWIIFLLSLLVFAMSRRSAIEVISLEHYQGKLCSYAAARAGVNQVLQLLNASPTTTDTLFATGVNCVQGQTPADLFSHIDVGDNAYAIVEWEAEDFSSYNRKRVYGLEDEGGKININAINMGNYRILGNLFELEGLPKNEANALALRIAAYTTAGAATDFSLKDDGAEQLKPKHKPFEHLEELFNISGVTPGLFKKIKKDLTVYGDAVNGMVVNLNTANNRVIRAVVNAAAELDPAVHADSLTAQAYALRDGADGISFTSDDGKEVISSNVIGWPAALRQSKASFVRAHVTGVDKQHRTRTEIDTVIEVRAGLTGNAIVGWHRD